MRREMRDGRCTFGTWGRCSQEEVADQFEAYAFLGQACCGAESVTNRGRARFLLRHVVIRDQVKRAQAPVDVGIRDPEQFPSTSAWQRLEHLL